MKHLIAMMILLLMQSAYGQNLKFDSAHTLALDGYITDGVILSRTNYDYNLKREIKEQLMYVIGQMNGLDGGSPDMNRLEISVNKKERLESGLYKVTYAAKLFLAWPNDVNFPETYELILPQGGDYNSLNRFFKAFGSDENSGSKCLDGHAHDVTQEIFWYYYRPNQNYCTARLKSTKNKSLVRFQNIQLAVSDQNTKGKSPEYGKIWEDEKLVATLIFGKGTEGAITEYDAGVSAYKQTINALIGQYGKPLTSTVPFGYRFNYGLKNPTINMTFKTKSGLLDISLYLIEGIRSATSNFRNSYNERTLVSDYVSYSGHSGLGANIRALANMGEFQAGQYKVFLINGCDTFAYVDDALRNAHQSVNPEYGKDKFVDVITNAMPSYFHMNYRSNMAIINGMVGRSKTYKQILRGFDKKQRAVVTGEQDNNWPKSFY
ncbi:MAG: hypothetical protein HN576_15045 [Bacteriovoracaceae bacterium]|nr:hypothetical protein [Bacteriovoracaceae bacterium]